MDSEARNTKNLSKEQKTGFVLLLVFGLLAVGLGILQMRNTIYSPFVIRVSKEGQELKKLFSDPETRLQTIDTDRDGLNDYEELSFYNTSPYLPDTDSDGISDKEEIDTNRDPNCPEGKTCFGTQQYDQGDSTTTLVTSPLANTTDPLAVFSQMGLVNGDASTFFNMQEILKDPKQLRAMLISTGQVPEDVLSQISDEDLLKYVQETTGQNTGVNNNTGSASSFSLSDIQSSLGDPTKLRQILASTGQIPQDVLDKVDDKKLVEMVTELLTQQQ